MLKEIEEFSWKFLLMNLVHILNTYTKWFSQFERNDHKNQYPKYICSWKHANVTNKRIRMILLNEKLYAIKCMYKCKVLLVVQNVSYNVLVEFMFMFIVHINEKRGNKLWKQFDKKFKIQNSNIHFIILFDHFGNLFKAITFSHMR